MGDGRWEMGSGDGDAGRRSARPSVNSRPTLLRFFDISPPPPRMHGTTADVEGWLLAAALAGATRAFLSPWRHHALLRDAPRPGRRPGAKSRGRDRGQLDSPLYGGPGSVYLLRGVYVSSTGSWSPPPPIFGGPWAGLPAWVRRRTARGSSAVSCRRSSKMRDTVLGRDEIKPSPKLGDLFCLRVPVFLLLPLR